MSATWDWETFYGAFLLAPEDWEYLDIICADITSSDTCPVYLGQDGAGRWFVCIKDSIKRCRINKKIANIPLQKEWDNALFDFCEEWELRKGAARWQSIYAWG